MDAMILQAEVLNSPKYFATKLRIQVLHIVIGK